MMKQTNFIQMVNIQVSLQIPIIVVWTSTAFQISHTNLSKRNLNPKVVSGGCKNQSTSFIGVYLAGLMLTVICMVHPNINVLILSGVDKKSVYA